MKLKILALVGIAFILASQASAQDAAPKAEIYLDYSYFRFNPQNNDIIRPFSLNGGGGGFIVYINRMFGIEGDFQGYSTFRKNTVLGVGTPLCPAPTNTSPCSISLEGNLFTYNAGPILKFRAAPHFEPFIEALGGGAHSNFYGKLASECSVFGCVVSGNSPSNNAFDFMIGGGIDIPVSEHFGIRLMQVDYVLTRFGNNLTLGNNNQSSFRAQAGIFFRAGSIEHAPPVPPTASCSANPSSVYVGSNDAVSVQATASDARGLPLTYVWTASGGTVEGTGPQARWSSSGLAVGDYTITARVTNSKGVANSCEAIVHIEARPNHAPTMTCSASPTSVHPGEPVQITASAADPDNDQLTFRWTSNGGQVSGTGAQVQVDTAGLAASHYTATGRVEDGRGGAADCQASFDVAAPPPPPAVEARLALRSAYFPTALPTAAKPDVGLIESQQRTLTSLATDFKEYLAAKPDARLVLQGHADPRGTKEGNQSLSQRRVDAVKSFLVSQGVPEGNLDVQAYGEEKALSEDEVRALVEQHPNLTDEQKKKIYANLKTVTLAQNRRVDIVLSATGQQSVRQFPFNAEDALTLLSPTVGGARKRAPKQ
jgi:outer membrane protein OmpA-like peptidoglycan-associated protein/opacity protein-like surface antigen